jgi:hypothetical protein
MDVGGSPSVQLRATAQQHLHQPHHPGVVNLDSCDSGLACRNRQSHPLKQWKVHVNVQRLRLETSEAICDADEFSDATAPDSPGPC